MATRTLTPTQKTLLKKTRELRVSPGADIREKAVADALRNSPTINRFAPQGTDQVVAQAALNAKYGLPGTTGMGNTNFAGTTSGDATSDAQLINGTSQTPTPTTITGLVKDALNQRIAASRTSMQPQVQGAVKQAMLGPDVTQFPNWENLSPDAINSIQTSQQQGLTGRAQGLLGLQEALGNRVDVEMGELKDRLAEQDAAKQQEFQNQFAREQFEESKNQFGLNYDLSKANQEMQNTQFQQQFGENQRQFGLTQAQQDKQFNLNYNLSVAAQNQQALQNAWQQEYQKEQLKLQKEAMNSEISQQEYANKAKELETKSVLMTNAITALGTAPKDQYGNLTPQSEAIVKNLFDQAGLRWDDGGGSEVETLNASIAGTPSPNFLGTVTTPVGTKTATHSGQEIDIVLKGGMGAKVPAFVGGTVSKVVTGKTRTPGSFDFGNYVEVTDPSGARHIYGHFNDVLVKVGDKVQAGQFIGTQGNSGDSRGQTGIHLHYQVTANGKKVDAVAYVNNYKKKVKEMLSQKTKAVAGYLPGSLNELLSSVTAGLADQTYQYATEGIRHDLGASAALPQTQTNFASAATPATSNTAVPGMDMAELNRLKGANNQVAQIIYAATVQGVKPQEIINSIAAAEEAKGLEEGSTIQANNFLRYLYPNSQPVYTPQGSTATTPEQQQAEAYKNVKLENFNATIDDALAQISPYNTGAVGAYSNYPGSPSYSLDQKIKSIQANIGLNELMAMREASKTGASGMGALSDREMMVLQSALGTLNVGMDSQELIKNLKTIKAAIERYRADIGASGQGDQAADDILLKYKVK